MFNQDFFLYKSRLKATSLNDHATQLGYQLKRSQFRKFCASFSSKLFPARIFLSFTFSAFLRRLSLLHHLRLARISCHRFTRFRPLRTKCFHMTAACGRCRAACCVRLRSIKLPHVIPHPFTPALQWVAGGDKNLHAEKKRGVHPTFKTYQKLVPKYGITWRFFQPSLKELPNYKEKKNFLKTIFRLLGPFGGKGVLSFPGFFSRLHLHLVSKLEMSTSRGNPLYLEGNVKAFNLVPQIFDTSNGFQNHWEIFKASYYFLKINVF